MSGAFNIDIECGNGQKPKSIKIYCASLTDTWSVERDQVSLAQFHAGLSKEQSIQKNKINLGNCPKTDNIDACERTQIIYHPLNEKKNYNKQQYIMT